MMTQKAKGRIGSDVEQEEARETVKHAAVAAWEGYQKTGLHATFEEADAWLAELEGGQPAEPPQSHT